MVAPHQLLLLQLAGWVVVVVVAVGRQQVEEGLGQQQVELQVVQALQAAWL